jgi:hypothetical protein
MSLEILEETAVMDSVHVFFSRNLLFSLYFEGLDSVSMFPAEIAGMIINRTASSYVSP